MDPVDPASKGYMALVVYAGVEDTMRQAELQIKLKDKSEYLTKMAKVYGFDPSSMSTLVDLSGELAVGTGLGDIMELVVKKMGSQADSTVEKVTAAFQNIADVLAIKKEEILVPIMWYSDPANTRDSAATVPQSCKFVSGRRARAAVQQPCLAAGELQDDLFTALMKVEMPAQTLKDVTSSDAARPAAVPAPSSGCGRCHFKSTTTGGCESCPPGTYQASDANTKGADSCKNLQCWAGEDAEPSLAVLQARLPCALPAEDAAIAAKNNKHVAAQLGSNAIKKMFEKLSVSLGPAAAAKFDFTYQFPTSVEAAWAPEAGSVTDLKVLKALQVLLPKLTIRTNALAGVPLLSSPQSKFNGMSGGSDEFKANYALHQFGGNVGVDEEAKGLDKVLLNSARSVDIEMDWKAVDELVEIATGSANDADAMFQADVSLKAKIYNIKGTSTPAAAPCTTFCDGILDANAWSAAFPEDGYNDWVHGYGPSVKQWPKIAQMFSDYKQKVQTGTACYTEHTSKVGLPEQTVALMFNQETIRETLRHTLWLKHASDMDKMRACTMMIGAKLKHGSNMMSPPWETTELTHDGRGASGYNKEKALAKYGRSECSMPMFRKAAFCTRAGKTTAECSAIVGCEWTKGNVAFNTLNPSTTLGSCHISATSLVKCATAWKVDSSMAWSMPENYDYVDGQILGGRNKPYGNRALPRLFVFAETAKPREVELNVNGDFVFQFPKGSSGDKKESADECPAAGNSNFIKVPIKVTGSKVSLASPKGNFFDPWGNTDNLRGVPTDADGQQDNAASAKYTYRTCPIWQSVLNEVMYMFSPNFGSPAAKAITLNKKGEQLSSKARKHSKTVYDAVNSRWAACTHGTKSTVPWTRCAEAMPLSTKAKWQEWLYDTKVSNTYKRQVMLPRRPVTASSGGSAWQLQMQIPDVSIESIICLAGKVDPVLEIGESVQAAKAEMASEQAAISAGYKKAASFLEDPAALQAAIDRARNVAKMLTDGYCISDSFSSEKNFKFSFDGWKKSLVKLGIGLPPSLRDAFGIVNRIEVDLGAKLEGPCIKLSLGDMTALAASAKAKMRVHAKVDASATLPRLSFREAPAPFKIPLEDPTPDLCGAIFISDLIGSVGWRTEFGIAVRWEASGSLESNTAEVKLDLDFLASFDVQIENGKIAPTVLMPKEWPAAALPTINMLKKVEGKGQLRIELILDITLFVFPTRDKEYGKDQNKCATDGKGGTTNVKGTVTLALVCDADLGKLQFGCKPDLGTAVPGRQRRALQGNLGGVDVIAEVNFPMCVGDSEGKVALGEKTVDVKKELVTRYPFLKPAANAAGLKAFTITVKSWVEDACGVFSIRESMNPVLEAGLVAKGSFDLNLDVELKVDEKGVIGGMLCIPLDDLSKTKTLTLPMGLPAIDFAFLTKLKLWITADGDDLQSQLGITIRATIKAETSATVKMVMSKDGVKPEFGVPEVKYNKVEFTVKQGDRPGADIPVTFHIQLSNAFAVMESGTDLLDEGCVPVSTTPAANLQGMVFAKAEATVLAEMSCKLGSNPPGGFGPCKPPGLPKLGFSLDVPGGGTMCLEPKDYVAKIDLAALIKGPPVVKAALKAALGTLDALDASVTLAVEEACMTVNMANPMNPSLSIGLSAKAKANFFAKATVPAYDSLESVPWVCIPVAGDPITGVLGMPKIFERLGFTPSVALRYTIATAMRIRAHGDKNFQGKSFTIKAGAQVEFRMAGDISKNGVQGSAVGPHLTMDDGTGISFTGFDVSDKTRFPNGATVKLEVELLTALTLSEDGKNIGSVMPFCGAGSGSSTPAGAFGSMVGSVGLILTCTVDSTKTLGLACSTILKPMEVKKRHRGFSGSLSDTSTLSSAGMFASLQYRKCEPTKQVFFDVATEKQVALLGGAVSLTAQLRMGAPAHTTCFGFSLSDPSTPTLNMGFELETKVDFSASLRLNGVRNALACIPFEGASTVGLISLPQSMGGKSLMQYSIATTVHVTIQSSKEIKLDGLKADMAFSAMVRNKLSLDIEGSDIQAAVVPTVESKTVTFKLPASIAGLELPITFTANVRIIIDGTVGSPGSRVPMPRCSDAKQQKQRESTSFAVVSAQVSLAMTCVVSTTNYQDVACTMADPKGDVVAVIPSAQFQWGARVGRSGGRSRRLSASEPERIVDLTGDVPAGTASVRYRDGSSVHGSRSRRSEIANSGSFAQAGLVLDFEFKGIAYSVSLELAPSLFADDAKIHHGNSTAPANLHEPATYKTNVKTGNTGLEHAAVITVGESGQISGVVYGTNGDQIEISNNGGANKTVSVVEMKPDPAVKCGNAVGDDHKHAHESGNNGTRGRRASEPWFGSDVCYTNDAAKRSVKMGFAFTEKMYKKVGGTDALAEFWLADALAKVNMLYETQLNIVLNVGALYFSKGDQTWDNAGCNALWNYEEQYPDIDEQLKLFRAWTKPSKKALWHLFDDCFAPSGCGCTGGTAGLAYLGVLCKNDGGTGITFNTGGNSWKVLAHEVGHNFGASHSFEEGMKMTGGIMDYDDGVYNGVVQFNTKYRKTQVCAHIKSRFDSMCDGNQVAPYAAVCGDGIADADSGETCECADKTQSCRFCTKCKLTVGKECTPDDFALPAQACCGNDGMFVAYGSECTSFSGHPGMCNAGNCLDARQSLLGLMGNVNPLGLLGPFDGLKIKKCDDVSDKTKTWELKPSVLRELLESFTKPVFKRLDNALKAANQVMADLKNVLALAKAAAAKVAADAASCAAVCNAGAADKKAACLAACDDKAKAAEAAKVAANAKITAQAVNVATAETILGKDPTGSMINKLGKFTALQAWITIAAESACAEVSLSNAGMPRISIALVMSLGIKVAITTRVPKIFQSASVCSAENALPIGDYSSFEKELKLPMEQLGTLKYGLQSRVCFEMEGSGDLEGNSVTVTLDVKALFKMSTTMVGTQLTPPGLSPAGIRPGTDGGKFLTITSSGNAIKQGGIRGRITIDTRLTLGLPKLQKFFGDGPFLVVNKAVQLDVSCSYIQSEFKCDYGYTFVQPNLQPNSPAVSGSLVTAFKPVTDLFTSFPMSVEDILKKDPEKLSNALLMVWGNVVPKPKEATDQCGRFARSFIKKQINLPLPAANVFVAQLFERFLPMGIYNSKIAVESSVTGCEPKVQGFKGCDGLDKAACMQKSATCTFAGMNWKTFQESLMCDWSLTTDVEIPFVGRVPFSKKINMFDRCNGGGGTRQRRTTGEGYLVDLDNNDTVTSSVTRRAATSALTSVAFGFELPNLPAAFKAVFGKVPAVNPEKIHDILNSMLGTTEIGLIVSNVPISMTDISILPDMPSLATLPSTFKFVPGVTMFAVLSVSQCASKDMICNFVKSHFGADAATFLSMTIGFEPSATATVGLGGLTLQKDDRCASATKAAKVELSEASVFIRAGTTSITHGVRVALALELGDPKKAGKCDAGAMVQPLIFKGEFFATIGVAPKLGGKLTMDGIYYQAFGLKMLHFAELEVNLAFTPPLPIPTAFQATGTLAIGEKCYLKDGTTSKITDNPNRGTYCVLAKLDLGFDAFDPRQTYASATLESFNVETMVNLFAPAGTAAQVFETMPAMVSSKLKESGFMGVTTFSFTASPFGATDLTGNSIPGGLRMEGMFNFMGWNARAKVIVVPFMSMYIDMVVDPLNILGVFKLQTGYEQGCSPKAPPLNKDYYAKAKTHCQKFANKATCESNGPRPAKKAADAAAGEVATDSQGRKWKATARQSGNAAAITIVWMPIKPFVDNPQCQWHGANEGPHFLLDVGFAGDIREITTLAAAGVDLMHGELPDISKLLSKVNFNLELSGKVTLLGASAASVMKISKTQYSMVTNFNNFLGVPSATAKLTTVADVSESPKFRVAGELGLEDVVGTILNTIVSQLQIVKTALTSLTDVISLSEMEEVGRLYTQGVEALAWIKTDVTLGPCFAAPFEGAITLMDVILANVELYTDAVIKDGVVTVQKKRVTTMPMLIKYIKDNVAKVTKLMASAIPTNQNYDLKSLISMSAKFDVEAGSSASSAEFAFTGTLFGKTATFDASLNTGLSPAAIVAVMKDKLMNACASFIADILKGAPALKTWFRTNFAAAKSGLENVMQNPCADDKCKDVITAKWNDVIMPSIRSTGTALAASVGTATTEMTTSAAVLGLGDTASTTANGLFDNVNTIPSIASFTGSIDKLKEIVASKITPGIKTAFDAPKNALNAVRPTLQANIAGAGAFVDQFKTIDFDSVTFDISVSEKKFKMDFKMKDGKQVAFNLAGRRRRDLIGLDAAGTELRLGRRSTASDCASIAASSLLALINKIIATYVPTYQTVVAALDAARNAAAASIASARTVIASINTNMKNIEVAMPVIKVTGFEMYKCGTDACRTQGATLTLNTAAIVEGSSEPKLLASADVYARITLLNSNTALTMSAYNNKFDFKFNTANLFGIQGLDGAVAIEWRKSNGLQFNFLLNGAGMNGKVAQVTADVRARTDAAKTSAQTSLNSYKAAAKSAADNVCANAFSAGALLTLCNTIIDSGVGSALKVVFAFVETVLAGAMEAVNAIVTGILTAGGKIFDMNKLRLHGSLGGTSTAIGAEVDVALFGVAGQFKGTMNVATMREWLMTQVLAASGTVPPKLRDVAATITASIAQYANIVQQATAVVTSTIKYDKCVYDRCYWYASSSDKPYWCPLSRIYWDGGYAADVAASDKAYYMTKEVCVPGSVGKPVYPSEWPANLKSQFDGVVMAAWGGRIRKSEQAKLFESIRRIAAANVVEEWTARQGHTFVNSNTTNTAKTPDFKLTVSDGKV
jgi:hypothetical protein